jgi:hypothetical protein
MRRRRNIGKTIGRAKMKEKAKASAIESGRRRMKKRWRASWRRQKAVSGVRCGSENWLFLSHRRHLRRGKRLAAVARGAPSGPGRTHLLDDGSSSAWDVARMVYLSCSMGCLWTLVSCLAVYAHFCVGAGSSVSAKRMHGAVWWTRTTDAMCAGHGVGGHAMLRVVMTQIEYSLERNSLAAGRTLIFKP